MKKTLFCLLICLFMCLALTVSAEDAAVEAAVATEETVEAVETTETAEVLPVTLLERAMLVAEDMDQLIIMTEDDLYDLIGIAPEEYTDFAYLAHVDSLTGRELIIVEAVDEAAALRIVELLQGYLEVRLHETRNYLPETYRVLCEAQVTQKDLLVVLSIAAPNPAEEELLLTEE